MNHSQGALEARIMEVLREAARVDGPDISRTDAKTLLEAFESVDVIMKMLVERQKAKALIEKLQQVKGVAPVIILRMLVKPHMMARLVRELEKELEDELERLRVEQLEEERKILQAAIAMLMAWHKENSLSARQTLNAVIAETLGVALLAIEMNDGLALDTTK